MVALQQLTRSEATMVLEGLMVEWLAGGRGTRGGDAQYVVSVGRTVGMQGWAGFGGESEVTTWLPRCQRRPHTVGWVRGAGVAAWTGDGVLRMWWATGGPKWGTKSNLESLDLMCGAPAECAHHQH